MGNSMNQGNWRVHILGRNEPPIHPWTKGAHWHSLLILQEEPYIQFFSKNIPIFEVVTTNLNL